MNTNPNAKPKADRSAWVRPELKRLEAGAAESQRGATPDGGAGFQGS